METAKTAIPARLKFNWASQKDIKYAYATASVAQAKERGFFGKSLQIKKDDCYLASISGMLCVLRVNRADASTMAVHLPAYLVFRQAELNMEGLGCNVLPNWTSGSVPVELEVVNHGLISLMPMDQRVDQQVFPSLVDLNTNQQAQRPTQTIRLEIAITTNGAEMKTTTA